MPVDMPPYQFGDQPAPKENDMAEERKEDYQRGVEAGRTGAFKEAAQIIQREFERHEDNGDERYGWVKYFNTMLHKFEDDLLFALQAQLESKSHE